MTENINGFMETLRTARRKRQVGEEWDKREKERLAKMSRERLTPLFAAWNSVESLPSTSGGSLRALFPHGSYGPLEFCLRGNDAEFRAKTFEDITRGGALSFGVGTVKGGHKFAQVVDSTESVLKVLAAFLEPYSKMEDEV